MTVRGRLLTFLRARLGPDGLPLRLRFWDGDSFDLGPAPKITIILTNPTLLRSLARGDIDALGDAYVAGTLGVEGRLGDIIGVGIDLAQRAGRYAWIGRMLAPLGRLRRFRHSRAADAAAISHHYDVSNDFYALWLDRRLIYSCAYFATGNEDIDEAQVAKLDHLCRKLRLAPGERLLDIGCGWGGLAVHAAQNYGVEVLAVTVSARQVEEARRRVAAAGLASRVTIEQRDYRDVAGEAVFDKIVSVGMYEHVGLVNLPLYFGTIRRLLKVGGVALNHGITTGAIGDGTLAPRGSAFIDRYVFPGGELPHVSRMVRETAAAGLDVIDIECLRPHYTQTLLHWVRRLAARQDEAVAMVGPEKYRIWRIYMAGSALAFDRGWLSLYQTLSVKPDGSGYATRPWTRAYQYPPYDPPLLSRPLDWGDL
ncbi:MAG TPA: cyclopropane-fatty-acyl-phospholipid synthase family protein [Stellaceae bacterium]|jgi:cyclopropane-fatty-acyl-phospholipid synthase|nr:cyclopropane-fatty-acyl-phospholipid synthase family protein [Stellaceae bacterium]